MRKLLLLLATTLVALIPTATSVVPTSTASAHYSGCWEGGGGGANFYAFGCNHHTTQAGILCYHWIYGSKWFYGKIAAAGGESIARCGSGYVGSTTTSASYW